jgi:hypothetical protein
MQHSVVDTVLQMLHCRWLTASGWQQLLLLEFHNSAALHSVHGMCCSWWRHCQHPECALGPVSECW